MTVTRTPRLRRRLALLHFGIVHHVRRGGFRSFGGFLRQIFAGGFGVLRALLRLIGVLVLGVLSRLFLAAALLLFVFLLLAFGIASVLAHVEVVQQIVYRVGEFALIVDQCLQAIETSAGAIFDQRAPEFDQVPG